MSAWVGDFRTGKTIRKMWNSNAIAGESITRATNGTVSVYKDGNTTQSTTGVTDTEDFDSLTGVHLVAIDTSADGTFYSAGSDFEVVLSAATIDGKTINATLFSFSLENRSHLMPTTDGRKLDVSAGGEAGVDWANIGSPTTAVNLSGTTVKTATDVESDTADIQSRLPAALVSGRIDASVGAMANNVLTAAAINADAITAAKIADGAIDAATFAAGAITATVIATDAIDADALADNAITAATFAAGAINAAAIANGAIDAATFAAGAIDSTAAPNLDAAVSSRSTVTTAQVNAEVVDALATDTYAEPGSVPAATTSLAVKIGWLQALARNKIEVDASEMRLRNDADSGTVGTAAVADDGTTFTRSEFA